MKTKLAAIALGAVTIAGCTPVAPLPGVPAAQCSVDRLGALVGKPASPMLVGRAKRRSGASLVRVIAPNMRVTMDYRTGRLNVWTDLENKVERFSCG